jgi:hypothetical protein
MNKWVKNSFKLAASHGYLDDLSDIYPVDTTIRREIDKKAEGDIIRAFRSGNKKELILTLLRLDRFPIDDPYIGFIRKDKNALDKNPKTFRRINKRLWTLGLKGILEGVSRPESSSRKMGHMFKKWLHGLGYPVLGTNQILKTKTRVVVLAGGDTALKKFAKKELGYRGDKGLDLVIKVGRRFVIGEAKFISTSGGTQDKSFRETMNFIKQKRGKALRMAVLDGVVWSRSKQKKKARKLNLYESVDKLDSKQIMLSALLLKDFIRTLA